MANWMKYYLVSQFNPGNGLNIEETLKESDFIDGNQVNPTGDAGIRPERNIMVTLDQLDAEDQETAETKDVTTEKKV